MSLIAEVIKNLPFTERARDGHFLISQSQGKFLPGDQKVLFFLLLLDQRSVQFLRPFHYKKSKLPEDYNDDDER